MYCWYGAYESPLRWSDKRATVTSWPYFNERRLIPVLYPLCSPYSLAKSSDELNLSSDMMAYSEGMIQT